MKNQILSLKDIKDVATEPIELCVVNYWTVNTFSYNFERAPKKISSIHGKRRNLKFQKISTICTVPLEVNHNNAMQGK